MRGLQRRILLLSFLISGLAACAARADHEDPPVTRGEIEYPASASAKDALSVERWRATVGDPRRIEVSGYDAAGALRTKAILELDLDGDARVQTRSVEAPSRAVFRLRISKAADGEKVDVLEDTFLDQPLLWQGYDVAFADFESVALDRAAAATATQPASVRPLGAPSAIVTQEGVTLVNSCGATLVITFNDCPRLRGCDAQPPRLMRGPGGSTIPLPQPPRAENCLDAARVRCPESIPWKNDCSK